MSYDLKIITDNNLNILISVMESLLNKADLTGARGPIKIGSAPKGVSNDEQYAVLLNLDKENLISFSIDGKSIWICEEIYVGKSFTKFYNEVHDEYHNRFFDSRTSKPIAPHYDQLNGIMYINDFKIKIKKHDEDTKQNQLLKHIFITNSETIAREFDFTEFPFDDVSDKKKFKEICRTACTSINKKIAKETNNVIVDFLDFNSRTYGYLRVNPNYLPKNS